MTDKHTEIFIKNIISTHDDIINEIWCDDDDTL